MPQHASTRELEASVKKLLKKLDDLCTPNGITYSPQVVKYTKAAKKIFESMQLVTANTYKSLQAIDTKITQLRTPATQPNQIYEKIKTVMRNTPKEPNIIPEVAIKNALKLKERTIKEALDTLQQLKEQLELQELEAYPKYLDGNQFTETQSEIISSFSRMTEEHKLQQKNLLSFGIQTDTENALLKLVPEIIKIIETVQSTGTQAEENTLNAEHYATMMHAKNNFASLKTEFAKLSADLNEQIKNAELHTLTATEIATLHADIKQEIILAHKAIDVYTIVLTNIDYEKERITEKYSVEEPRVPLLNDMGSQIHTERKQVEETVAQLEAAEHNADDLKRLTANKNTLIGFSERVQEERYQVTRSIQNIMSDERIKQLTTLSQNRLMNFIDRYVIRPIVTSFHQSSAAAKRSNFFQTKSEIRMTEEMSHMKVEPTADENTVKR